MEDKQNNQELIRDLFYKHASLIPDNLCDIVQYIAKDEEYDIGCDEMILEIRPKRDSFCSLSIHAGQRVCYGILGQFAYIELLPFNPHVDTDRLENFICAAIYGPVTETEWSWRGTPIRHITRAAYDTKLVTERTITQMLWYTRFFLPGVIKSSFTYDAYIKL